MTIETKYNINDEVWWKTQHYNGKGEVVSITATVSIQDDLSRTIYRVFIKEEMLQLTFFEEQLFASEEEMLGDNGKDE